MCISRLATCRGLDYQIASFGRLGQVQSRCRNKGKCGNLDFHPGIQYLKALLIQSMNIKVHKASVS